MPGKDELLRLDGSFRDATRCRPELDAFCVTWHAVRHVPVLVVQQVRTLRKGQQLLRCSELLRTAGGSTCSESGYALAEAITYL